KSIDTSRWNVGTEDNPGIIIGAGVENAIDIQGDRTPFPLKIFLPRKTNSEQIDPLEDISRNTITPTAVFLIQQDFDNKYGITNIDFVRKALKLKPDEYSGVEIAVKDPQQSNEIKDEVKKIFGSGYLVQNKYEQNRSLYSVMNLERWVIYGI